MDDELKPEDKPNSEWFDPQDYKPNRFSDTDRTDGWWYPGEAAPREIRRINSEVDWIAGVELDAVSREDQEAATQPPPTSDPPDPEP